MRMSGSSPNVEILHGLAWNVRIRVVRHDTLVKERCT